MRSLIRCIPSSRSPSYQLAKRPCSACFSARQPAAGDAHLPSRIRSSADFAPALTSALESFSATSASAS